MGVAEYREMIFFRHSPLMTFTNVFLALVMIMSAVRSEAHCFSTTSDTVAQYQTMENCGDMDADPVDSNHPFHTDHSDEVFAGVCHFGCPISLTANDTRFSRDARYSPAYLSELSPLMIGIMVLPQTPPPRMS